MDQQDCHRDGHHRSATDASDGAVEIAYVRRVEIRAADNPGAVVWYGHCGRRRSGTASSRDDLVVVVEVAAASSGTAGAQNPRSEGPRRHRGQLSQDHWAGTWWS